MAQSSSFGDLLRRYRLGAGLTQEALAERAGLSMPGISDLERGARRAPHADTVERLVAALHLAPADQDALEAAARAARPRSVPHPAVPIAAPSGGPADQQQGGSPDNALSAPQRMLPTPLTNLVGRVQEQAEVQRLLTTTRLLTLTGPGGCGKTRLALQVATSLAPEHAHGLYWVELAAIRDPLLVPQAVAAALNLREEPGRPLPVTLCEHLQARASLLLLDNCEHLVAACAELATTLLQACPRLRILTTSREALAITGEVTWPVPPLGVPRAALPIEDLARVEAVQLFLARARAVRPDFGLREENAGAVAAICRHLEGMPLAIELAAARLPALSVGEIASRLDERLRLLAGGSRVSPARQQSLRATLDWSYALLGESEQTLMRRLAMFAGGWTLAAAETVCAGGAIVADAVLDLLTQLVRKSLVVAEEQGGVMRYRLLETVRQYAEERLADSDEGAAARDRHLRWCLAVAEEKASTGPAQTTWLARLDLEHDNLRAALAWSLRGDGDRATGVRLAAAVRTFWELRGHLAEGRRWLELALAASAQAPAHLRGRAYTGAGIFAFLQGDNRQARTLLETSLALWREVGDPREVAYVLLRLGNVAYYQGDYHRATRLYEESLSLARAVGDTTRTSHLLNNLGAIASRRGEYREAMVLLRESYDLAEELGEKPAMANPLNNLGEAAAQLGEYERATSLFERSLALWKELGVMPGIAIVLANLGHVALMQADHERASALLEQSLALQRQLGDKYGIASVLSELGRVAAARGDPGRAMALFQESFALCRETGSRDIVVACLEGMAGVSAALGDPLQAARLWGAAEALRERLAMPLPPAERRHHERALAATRASVDAEQFLGAWSSGRAMAVKEAFTQARASQPAGSPTSFSLDVSD